MADFLQAIKWMKDNKKVRLPSWKKGYYASIVDYSWNEYLPRDILLSGFPEGSTYDDRLHLREYDATDWEIYDDAVHAKDNKLLEGEEVIVTGTKMHDGRYRVVGEGVA